MTFSHVWALLGGVIAANAAASGTGHATEFRDLSVFMHEVAAVALADSATVIVARESTLIVGARDSLRSFSVDDPLAPLPLDSQPLPHPARHLSWVEDRLYVLAGEALLLTYDTADRSALSLIGSAALPVAATDIDASGRWVFVSAGLAGLIVLDAQDPSALEVVTTVDTPGEGLGVATNGALALVADGIMDLAVYDVADPMQPRFLHTIDWRGSATEVELSGESAYVVDPAHGVQVIQPIRGGIADPHIQTVGVPGNVTRLTLAAHEALAITRGPHSRVAAITDQLAQWPILSGIAGTGISALDVAAAGGHAYVVGGRSGMRIVQASPPSTPFVSNPAELDWYFDATGDRGYLAGGDWVYDLRVFDLTDPRSPRLMGQVPMDRFAVGVRAAPPYVYVAVYRYVYIFDVSDGAHPRQLSTLELPGGFFRVTDVVGGNRYCFFVDDELWIWDVTDPAAPRFGSTTVIGPVSSPHLRPPYLFAAGPDGIVVYDVNDAGHPTLVGVTPSDAVQLDIVGDHLVALTLSDVLTTYDASDPANLVSIGSIEIPIDVWDVRMDGAAAIMTAHHHGLAIGDLSDPANPAYVGVLPLPFDAQGVRVANAVYAEGPSRDGWMVIPRSYFLMESTGVPTMNAHDASPPLFVLQSIPWSDRPRFEFRLAREAIVSADVYDVRGRRVAQVADQRHLLPGTHSITWDPTRRVVSGIYFVKLESGGETVSSRVHLAR
jgi:hypothetical protein